MPQFLRCITMLCSLYPNYNKIQLHHNTARSLPRDLMTTSSARVRRTDSLGSHLESSRSTRAATLSFFSNLSGSHRRTNSHGAPVDIDDILIERESMISASLGDVASMEFPADPFEALEVVWTSLASWFDLLKKEVIKIEATDDSLSEAVPELSSTPTDTSQLAAAIVLSVPPKRRQVFLQNSLSLEGDSFCRMNSKELKRRSWHVERFARVLALEEDQEFSSLPSFYRSISSDPTGRNTGMSLCSTGTSLCGTGMSLCGTGMSLCVLVLVLVSLCSTGMSLCSTGICSASTSLCGTGMSLCSTGMSL